MKKLQLLLCLLLLNTVILLARPIDSLLQVLPLVTDTTRVQLLNDITYELLYNEPKTAKLYAMEARRYAQQISYVLGEAKALIRLGIVYDVTGKYDSAVICYQLAGVQYAKINNIKGKASAINNIGMLYAAKGNFSRALGNYFEAIRLFELINDENNLANVYNNIGIVYSDMFKHRFSLRYFTPAATINAKNNNLRALASCYTNMGRVYDDLEMVDSALYYYNQALTIEQKQNNLYGLGILYNNISLIYSGRNKHQEALKYLNHALHIKQQLNDETGMASTLFNIAGQYHLMKQSALFEKYALQSHELSLKLNSYRMLRKTSFALMKHYEQKKQFDKAYAFARVREMARDSVLNEESNKQIIELEGKYESEKMSLEIEKQGLALDKAQLEIQQKKGTIIILIIVSALVLSVLFSFYRRYQYRQQRAFDAEVLKQQELRNKAIIETEEKERIRIARELHDGIGQQLSAAKMNLSAFENKISEQDKTNYEMLVQLVDDAVKEVRSVSHNMMPNALIRSGLVSAVRDFVHKLSSTDALKVDLQIVGLNNRLEDTTETVLYRVLQECVSNIIKHAGASHISIQLIKHDTHLNMLIEDNGKGFDTNLIHSAEGIGLKNMISRIAYLNGTIELDSTPGNGSTVNINIPLTSAA